LVRTYLEKIHHKKRTGGMAQGIGPEFTSQNHKKAKEATEDFFRGGREAMLRSVRGENRRQVEQREGHCSPTGFVRIKGTEEPLGCAA
jgi:hypothetical protein